MTNFPEDAMDPSQHPEDDLIQDYLKTPEAGDFSALRLHLAGCSYCRRRTEITALLRTQGEWLETDAVAADARVDDYFSGRLETAEADSLRDEIKKDPARLRAALHYASHARSMREIDQRAAPPAAPADSESIGARIGHWLGFGLPRWQMAPVLAVLMALAIVLLVQLDPSQSGGETRVIAFADDPVVKFVSQQRQPGIGFFSQQNIDSRPFAGMTIEIPTPDTLRFSWPEIERASGYNLKLQVFRDGETLVLTRQNLNLSTTEVVIDEGLTQHRYEWVLSGNTSDERSFQASGGFVVTQN